MKDLKELLAFILDNAKKGSFAILLLIAALWWAATEIEHLKKDVQECNGVVVERYSDMIARIEALLQKTLDDSSANRLTIDRNTQIIQDVLRRNNQPISKSQINN